MSNQSFNHSLMPERQLGKNGPKVSAIGYGAMGLSMAHVTAVVSDEERFKILDRAIEFGSTYFDSADRYGDNEDLLGKYFKKHPQQRKKVSKTYSNRKFKYYPFLSIGVSCNKVCLCNLS